MAGVVSKLKSNTKALETLARAQGAETPASALDQANKAMQLLEQIDQP